jgi:hypothetical protein
MIGWQPIPKKELIDGRLEHLFDSVARYGQQFLQIAIAH